MLVTRIDTVCNIGYPLECLNGMIIPKNTPVRTGMFSWNKDSYFIDGFSWLPTQLLNNSFFMGDLRNYGINVTDMYRNGDIIKVGDKN